MQGLTDAEFERQYGTEAQCVEALLAARQAVGVACPRCANAKTYFHAPRRRFGCTRCDTRLSLTSGTVLADTKLPLRHWFRAMHMMTSTKQGISAIELGRRLGVRYRTAWYLHKRLRHALIERDGRYQLGGETARTPGAPGRIVEADDAYLDGERNQGPETAGKSHVIAVCERREPCRMGYVAMQAVTSFSSDAMQASRDCRSAPGTQVHTDGSRCFNGVADAARAITHHPVVTGGKRPARERSAPLFCINTLVANLSTAIKATHKAVSPKPLPDYLGAFCWTTNRRWKMADMINATCRAVVSSTRLTRETVYAEGRVVDKRATTSVPIASPARSTDSVLSHFNIIVYG